MGSVYLKTHTQRKLLLRNKLLPPNSLLSWQPHTSEETKDPSPLVGEMWALPSASCGSGKPLWFKPLKSSCYPSEPSPPASLLDTVLSVKHHLPLLQPGARIAVWLITYMRIAVEVSVRESRQRNTGGLPCLCLPPASWMEWLWQLSWASGMRSTPCEWQSSELGGIQVPELGNHDTSPELLVFTHFI